MQNFLPSNLRAMRKAVGETRRDLAEAVGVDLKTIDAYENGTISVPPQMLTALAKHFYCSVDRMMYEDLSHATMIRSDIYSTWKRMEDIFPIVHSEMAMENEFFRSAFQYHHDVFGRFQSFNQPPLQNATICLELYTKAIEDSTIEPEVTANMASLSFMTLYLVKWSKLIRIQPQTQRQPINQTEAAIRSAFVRLGPVMEPFARQYEENDFLHDVREMLITLKQSSRYSDLGDYYLALQYVLNIVDNDMPIASNTVAGAEMMRTLLFIKNKYARKYLYG